MSSTGLLPRFGKFRVQGVAVGGLGFWGLKLDSVMFMTAAAHTGSRSGPSGTQELAPIGFRYDVSSWRQSPPWTLLI